MTGTACTPFACDLSLDRCIVPLASRGEWKSIVVTKNEQDPQIDSMWQSI
ncbi:hypothetical protein N4G69_26405 [Streptomyces mirabilis]|nr:hypothetical protein [Streptomyces mirabilis]MCT9109101.1 hypothetical protein [Streptomyces mirabilis]